ncbi:hypothetical protein D3C73_1179820 [compost metagenome]
MTLGDGFDGATYDFGVVGAHVQREADQRGGQWIQHDAHAGQAVENDEQLHQQRRAPDQPHIEAHQRHQRRRPEQPDQRHHERQRQAQRERHQGQRHGEHQPGVQQRPERIGHQLHPGRHGP